MHVAALQDRHGRDWRGVVVADIVRPLDGALAPTYSVSRYFYEPTPIEREQSLVNFFQDIASHVSTVMENTASADVT